jgi:hypothetical protein|tara:strand:+ start:31 stop:282 length:252 start_codon:yes stop_codon:yes gene_type:complete
LTRKQLSAEQTDLEVKPPPDFSLADLSVGAAPRLCADQPVIASAFLDLAQICILTSVASFGLSQCRISRAKAFHQFILIVLGQ